MRRHWPPGQVQPTLTPEGHAGSSVPSARSWSAAGQGAAGMADTAQETFTSPITRSNGWAPESRLRIASRLTLLASVLIDSPSLRAGCIAYQERLHELY